VLVVVVVDVVVVLVEVVVLVVVVEVVVVLVEVVVVDELVVVLVVSDVDVVVVDVLVVVLVAVVVVVTQRSDEFFTMNSSQCSSDWAISLVIQLIVYIMINIQQITLYMQWHIFLHIQLDRFVASM